MLEIIKKNLAGLRLDQTMYKLLTLNKCFMSLSSLSTYLFYTRRTFSNMSWEYCIIDYCKLLTIFQSLTVCSYHVTYAFQSESTLYICLNVKELLARNRRDIWSLSGCGFESRCSHLNISECYGKLKCCNQSCSHSKISQAINMQLISTLSDKY